MNTLIDLHQLFSKYVQLIIFIDSSYISYIILNSTDF